MKRSPLRARRAAGFQPGRRTKKTRRSEMARISGERFQCPPPMLADQFRVRSRCQVKIFKRLEVRRDGAAHHKLAKGSARSTSLRPKNWRGSRKSTGPIQPTHRPSCTKQSIACGVPSATSTAKAASGCAKRSSKSMEHFQQLFTRLFEGGQAHLALIDSAMIRLRLASRYYAQPPGKRLQSLSAALRRRAGPDRDCADLRAVPH